MNNNFNKEDKTIATNKTINVDLEKLFGTQSSVLHNDIFMSGWQPYLGKCPHCGSTNIEADYSVVLTSLPPQYNCRCKDCKGTFFSGQIKQENQNINPAFPLGPQTPLTPNTPYQPDKPNDGYGNYGWICPKCGKVNAPHRDFCDCSGGGYYPNIVYCGGSGNNPNPAPTITVSGTTLASNENNVVEVLDSYSFKACNLHENKEKQKDERMD